MHRFCRGTVSCLDVVAWLQMRWKCLRLMHNKFAKNNDTSCLLIYTLHIAWRAWREETIHEKKQVLKELVWTCWLFRPHVPGCTLLWSGASRMVSLRISKNGHMRTQVDRPWKCNRGLPISWNELTKIRASLVSPRYDMLSRKPTLWYAIRWSVQIHTNSM